MTRIGFTGTRNGMTGTQAVDLRRLLTDSGATEFHHGDCDGADTQADAIARALGIPIHIHPPINALARAFCGRPGDVLYEPRPYLDRNHDIVDSTDRLIATPRSQKETLRSGTWATVRYARKLGRSLVILPP